jgi:hypothetical protein
MVVERSAALALPSLIRFRLTARRLAAIAGERSWKTQQPTELYRAPANVFTRIEP